MTRTSSQTNDRWTAHQLLTWMTGYLTEREVDSPRLSAEILLAHVLKCERLSLYTAFDRPASPGELSSLRTLVARAAQQEPVAYLTGEAWFFGLAFEVTRDTLIPRPSTETIVEHVLHHEKANNLTEGPLIADIGTGSGAISIALGVNLPRAHITSTDISAAAIEVAQCNAERHEVAGRIEFRLGSLLEPLTDFANRTSESRLDYLISNPPYVSDSEWDELPKNVKEFEPETALRAGPNGMDHLEPLIASAHRFLRPGGMLILEISSTHADRVRRTAEQNAMLDSPHILQDLDGHDRVLVATAREATTSSNANRPPPLETAESGPTNRACDDTGIQKESCGTTACEIS